MTYAQLGQVAGNSRRVVESEIRPELHPVCGDYLVGHGRGKSGVTSKINKFAPQVGAFQPSPAFRRAKGRDSWPRARR